MQQQDQVLRLDEFVTKKDIEDRLHLICKTAQIPDQQQEPQRDTMIFECHKQKQQSDCLQSYQFKHYFIYLFAKNYSNTSKITMYQFQKSDGSQSKKAFNQISGNIKCMKMMAFFKKPLDEWKKKEDAQSHFKILIGTSDGCLKILDPSPPYTLKTIKIDTKPLIMILDADYTYFHSQNMCVVLSQDNLVYFVDLQVFQIAFMLRPIVIMCDSGLSIKINSECTHLMQCTEGGYVIFWKMDYILAQLKAIKQKKQPKKHLNRHYGIFTQRIDHSMAVEGLIWCDFYGNLIIMITKEGILKICAYIFQAEGDFIVILSFNIGNAQAISHVVFHAELDMLLVSKNLEHERVIQKIQLDQEFRVQRVLKIVVKKIDFINQFYINKDFDILVCQSKKYFVINQSKILLEEPEDNQKQNLNKNYLKIWQKINHSFQLLVSIQEAKDDPILQFEPVFEARAYYLYMQEQFFNLTNQTLCPPPPEPLIKPQNQAFFQDQFQLETGKLQVECYRSSIEEQTMSLNLSERDSENHVNSEQTHEEKGSSLKRSLKEVHGERHQSSRYRLLTRLQRIDRMPAKRLHL